MDESAPVIVVTVLRCRSRIELAWVITTHFRLRRRIMSDAGAGLMLVGRLIDWRRLLYTNITVWSSVEDVRSMGGSKSHVEAVRSVNAQGLPTADGIFAFAGGWRQLLFGVAAPAGNPFTDLVPLAQEPREPASTAKTWEGDAGSGHHV